ncbi:MAG TPA: pyridoxamine 5'-phosphate oxidase family protein [Terriglobales bacterium]|nr:pyridoxamine 5'-phosphate oxidase family protein [Terriglobales bacterium]
MQKNSDVDPILGRALVGRIGMSLNGQPYVVPVNFLYSEGKIYFHSASKGQMYEYMKANPQVCFEVDEVGKTVPNADPCKFSFTYKSVIAFGKVNFIQDSAEKIAVLTKLVEKYDTEKMVKEDVTVDKLGEVAVGEISIERMTGKSNPAAQTSG